MNADGTAKPLDIGAEVIGVDGRKLGKVAYAVVRPEDMRTTNIVVSTGGFLGRDIIVPVSVIRDVVDGKVHLSIDRHELEGFPDYIEIDYRKPPTDWVPPPNLGYQATDIIWPATAYYPEGSGLRINAPPRTLGIREGLEVESSDGHKVGSVDALDIDVTTGELKGFVVKHGFLFTRDTHIPAGDVLEIRAEKVILKFTRDQLKEVEQAQSQQRG